MSFGSKTSRSSHGGRRKGKRFQLDHMAIVPARPSIPRQVNNLKKSVRRINNKEELKWKDKLLSNTSIPVTGTILLLNDLSQGDTSNTRTGSEVSATSIQFRALISQRDIGIDQEVAWRHIIFWDTQANSAAPNISGSDGLLDVTTSVIEFIAPYNRLTQKRFKVLYDKIGVLRPQLADPANATTQILSPTVVKRGKRKLSRVVKYDGNAGTVADIQTNALYSVWIATATPNYLSVNCNYRFYYKDD